ncbi:MAG: PKD domain-containing protein [Desulfobacteraceae bacterium]|nr:PKD domain-containing protein [Desulfobacteraceae bacterium]
MDHPQQLGSTVTHSYTTSGSYDVTLTLTLYDGSIVTSTRKIWGGPGTRYLQGHTITWDETWYSGGTYVITGVITVAEGASLTIEPGVTVKFGISSYLYVYGSLTARGTNGNQILFTSASANPKTDRWGGISFYKDSKGVMDYCVVEYGGYYGIFITGTSPVITNSVIRNNGYYGIQIYGNSSPTIRSCTISGNTYPITAQYPFHNVENITFSDNTNNQTQILTDTLLSDAILKKALSPYSLIHNLTIPAGITLTIESGVIVKLPYDSYNGPSRLYVYGSLTAKGGSGNQILFTSASSTPKAGDWGSINFYKKQ